MKIVINQNKVADYNTSTPLANGYHWLINYLIAIGYSEQNLPLADFLAHYHQLPGKWVVVTPIYWEASHNAAAITKAGSSLELSDSESTAWFEACIPFFAEIGLKIFYHDANVWLIQADDKPLLQAPTPFSLINQPLMPVLAAMDNTLYWQKTFTETQMWLSTHELNKKHAQPTINGLWFYGAGDFLASEKKALTDEPTLLNRFPQSFHAFNVNKIHKNSLLVMQQAPHLSSKCLAAQDISWYWNDVTYQTCKPRWWQKLRWKWK